MAAKGRSSSASRGVYGIASVSRAMETVELLASRARGCGVTDVAQHLGVAKSSAHRLLHTLIELGYVEEHEGTGKYRLTLRLFVQGTRLLHGLGLGTKAYAVVEQLATSSHFVVKVGVRDGDGVVIVYRVDPGESLRRVPGIGERLPLYCTSLGKAILGVMSDDDFESYVSESTFTRSASSTVPTLAALQEDRVRFQSDGYCIDRGEWNHSVWAVGAPVYDQLGRAVAAVSAAGPAEQLQSYGVVALARQVVRASEELLQCVGAPATLRLGAM